LSTWSENTQSVEAPFRKWSFKLKGFWPGDPRPRQRMAMGLASGPGTARFCSY
jgi:hypothetical protein